jgi:hypothetical protein
MRTRTKAVVCVADMMNFRWKYGLQAGEEDYLVLLCVYRFERCPPKEKRKKKKNNDDKRGIRTPASFLTRMRYQLADRRLNLSLAP